jgi:hypothetical protein
MIIARPTLVLAAVLLALAGCGKPANKPGPGGVTAGEARALDEAAEMIEAQRLPDSALRPGASAVPQAHPNQTQPAAKP